MKAKKLASFTTLPEEVLTEIFIIVASQPRRPLDDIKNLRQCCKLFQRICKRRIVGQNIFVDNATRNCLPSFHEYMGFLRRCAMCGNLRANTMLGLEETLRLGIPNGIQRLIDAAKGGFLLAGYAAGIILFKSEETRELGMQLLNNVAEGKLDDSSGVSECRRSGSATINQFRHPVARIFRDVMWVLDERFIEHRQWSFDHPPCGLPSTDVKHDLWLGEDGMVRTFCSQQCRWDFELCRFSNLL